jgi:uncharacterized protein (DUF2132 family)
MICAERTTLSKTQILLSQYNYTIFCFSQNPWKKDSIEFSFASLWARSDIGAFKWVLTYKRSKERVEVEQLQSDPWTLYLYAMKSPVTREKYQKSACCSVDTFYTDSYLHCCYNNCFYFPSSE